jgi:hypothetical protein
MFNSKLKENGLELLILKKKRTEDGKNSLYSNFKGGMKCEIKETSKFYIQLEKLPSLPHLMTEYLSSISGTELPGR